MPLPMDGSSLPTANDEEESQEATTTERMNHEAVKWVLDYKLTADEKVQNACHLAPPEEGSLEMDTGTKLTLSPALDWSGQFRKCYTLLMWMKPRSRTSSGSRDNWRSQDPTSESSLYRLEQAQTTQAWLGVEVTMGSWGAVGEHHVEAWIKATTLEGGTNAPRVDATLKLPTETWSLVGMTHVFPYLKRPQWSLSVNGQVIVNGDLPYPSLDHLTGKNAARNMDLTVGGFEGYLSSWAIYQEPIPPEAMALVAEAGPSISNSQQPGFVIPRVPPIANASKGYSLDGRSKVGCCLLVHPLSQALQPLVDAHVVGWGFHRGPTKRERLGSTGTTRYTWNLPKAPGRTKDVPRVGLIQPQPPMRNPFWTMTVQCGNIVVPRHEVIGTGNDMDESHQNTAVKRYAISTAPSLRLALADQSLHRWILPFFVSFPVTMIVDDALQAQLQRHSLRHLWGLLHEVSVDDVQGLPSYFKYARKESKKSTPIPEDSEHEASEEDDDDKVCLAAMLLHVLAEWIAVGGARVHEQLLQEGVFHMLSVCLRWTLLRAEAWELYRSSSCDVVVQRCLHTTGEEDVWMQQIQQGARRYRPKYIPKSVATAVVHLLEACFFGSSSLCGAISDIRDPWTIQWLQLRLTGDLALSALFGFALDFDLWGGMHYESAAQVWRVVAKAYGGCHIEAGTVVRSQISVQFLLDNIRLSLDAELQKPDRARSIVAGESPTIQESKHNALQESAVHLANILKAMLLSSLSNQRSISQAENDISACVGALSSCPLGTVGCHVILHALVGVLEWSEVLPPCVNADDNRRYSGTASDPTISSMMRDEDEVEDAKRKLATRLVRNLMSAQFHDVVAPMLLSRTVFAGDRRVPAPQPTLSAPEKEGEEEQPLLSWQNHWRWVLLIFSWCASMAGPEGIIAAKSSGSLILASGLAGSLNGILQCMEPNFVTTLFLPTIASSGADEDAYTDLLTARLQIMMPLLPGMVVSVLEHPLGDSNNTLIPKHYMQVLSELLTAVGASFSRIFSQWNMSVAPTKRMGNYRKHSSTIVVNQIIQSAKTFAPPLVIIIMLIEKHIQLKKEAEDESSAAVTLHEPDSIPVGRQIEDSDAYVEVSRIIRQLSSSALMNTFSHDEGDESKSDEGETMLSQLQTCQKGVMATLTDLIAVSMKLGGGEASTSLWRAILTTLKESVAYAANAPAENLNLDSDLLGPGPEEGTKEEAAVERKAHATSLAQNILCRVSSVVFMKCLRRQAQWEVWSENLCAAVSKMCVMIEERDLFNRLLGPISSKYGERTYSSDQLLLLGAFINVLEYGRNITGWCQILLPNMPEPISAKSLTDSVRSFDMGSSFSDLNEEPGTPQRKRGSVTDVFRNLTPSRSKSKNQAGGAAKLMLQVLQPSLRIVVGCVGNITTITSVRVPATPAFTDDAQAGQVIDNSTQDCMVLEYTLQELEFTLTAAIVGLSFANARDVCMNALAALRKAVLRHQHRKDDAGVELCYRMVGSVAEEMRVRYEGERRKRENALFDAYEENDAKVQKAEDAAESSQIVENMMLGGDLLGGGYQGLTQAKDKSKSKLLKKKKSKDEPQEINFDLTKADGPDTDEPGKDDFVMFPGDSAGADADGGAGKMGYAQYDGFAVALENCSIVSKSIKDNETETESETTESSNADKEVSMASSNADKVISTLAPFLDAFDETVALEAAETELVKLFDTNVRLDSGDTTTVVAIAGGAETAADAMTSYIEFASVEKARLTEISGSFLPGHRYSRLAYTHRICWARYIELSERDNDFSMEKFWERGINDGNRDVRSRLITMPCGPQFKRYIPKYLDHGPENLDQSTNTEFEASVAISEDSERPMKVSKLPKDMFQPRKSTKGRRKTEFFAIPSFNIDDEDETEVEENEMDIELDVFTKTLTAATGGQIVDITKKAIIDDDSDPSFAKTPRNDDDDDTCVAEEDQSKKGRKGRSAVPADDSMRGSEMETPIKGVSLDAKAGAAHYNITSSAFASPPDNSSSSLSIMHSAAAALIEQYLDNCLHVKAEGSRKCTMLLTSMHLILEYDMEADGHFDGEVLAEKEEEERQQRQFEEAGISTKEQELDRKVMKQSQRNNREEAHLRPKSIRFNLSEVSHIYLRRYRLRDSSLEMFFIPSGGTAFGGYGMYSPLTSLFLDFGPGQEGLNRRDDAAFAIMRRTPPQTIKQWPDRSEQFLHEQLNRLTIGWAEGRITNFDYLLHLNMLSGRSYNDICQYPVMPWVLSNYKTESIPDLNDPENFRDLTKPVGALNPSRLKDFIERFQTFADPFIPPFMYGSHYSTSAGVVLHFLVRMHPFAGLHRQLQSGHFDVADRLFSSIPRTWDVCTGSSAAEVKELTPEFYCNPSFLKNSNNFKLGTSQDGDVLGDVKLPPWAQGSPEKFVEVMRSALESEMCSQMLPDWIDLIFGRKQQGPEAVASHNVFFYLTYYGSVDVANIEDDGLREATELQIAHFGQCPMQLFTRPHIRRLPQAARFRKLSFYQLLSTYTESPHRTGMGSQNGDADQRALRMTEPAFLAFCAAPLSHWVQLDAPPPGPHAPLISVRLAGTDRCVAVDRQGIFHCFRWAWKSEEVEESNTSDPVDIGCFVAQRELPRFRSVPRLIYFNMTDKIPPVAISKTLFAGGSVLLVLSDGDGHGGLGMQLLDPSKGTVRGEAIVPSIHSARITCIAADPIGSAAGHGGVGGELAVVGSADGNASVWRFMSSHYLPLRPRVRLHGHHGSKVCAVAMSSAIQLVASTSSDRCCLFSIGNGCLLRAIKPPTDTLRFSDYGPIATGNTKFADTPALAISVQGYVVTVCETQIEMAEEEEYNRRIITLHLFTLEGISLGSQPLEPWRGVPHKMTCTPDGTAVLVCSGRGTTVHRLSSLAPLQFLDEWQITESKGIPEEGKVAHAWDIDLGPNLSRPVVAAAACSNGILRLHALPGISAWSDRHRKSNVAQSVGNALAKPAQRFKNVMSSGFGLGSKPTPTTPEPKKEEESSGGIGGFFRGFGRGGKK